MGVRKCSLCLATSNVFDHDRRALRLIAHSPTLVQCSNMRDDSTTVVRTGRTAIRHIRSCQKRTLRQSYSNLDRRVQTRKPECDLCASSWLYMSSVILHPNQVSASPLLLGALRRSGHAQAVRSEVLPPRPIGPMRHDKNGALARFRCSSIQGPYRLLMKPDHIPLSQSHLVQLAFKSGLKPNHDATSTHPGPSLCSVNLQP